MAFSNGAARFAFGQDTEQVLPKRDADVYHRLPYPIKLGVDPEHADEVRKYLISYYAGNMQSEMMERAMEAIAFMGVGHGLDKILVVRDQGRRGKTARSVLRRTVFGDRARQLSGSILTKDDEARKQLSQHMYAKIMDFDEFSSRDDPTCVVLTFSSETSIFIRRPYGKEVDQINWSWPSLLVVLSLNCVTRLCTADGDAAHMRFRVVERSELH